ncbi:MAG: aminoacetone oxidase family FAD-binding enzyme [Planctomycetes bacterium]|nr:aminoacetone oxidase family FAD-binding enzyme [Planctomycetota bacterium]
MTTLSCLIIGAGPAGLSAAIAAGRSGQTVTILEKNLQPGRKLLLTGGGRANLTDPSVTALDTAGNYGKSGRFLYQALAAFDYMKFLNELGISIEQEQDGLRKGSIYVRGGAQRLLEALLAEAERLQIEIVPGAAVQSAVGLPDGGFKVKAGAKNRHGDRLIIATGGITYPSTGSCGDGYRLAESFGNLVEPPRPALCPFHTEPRFPELSGITVADAKLTIQRQTRKLATRQGALLFTHTGVSGPPVLDLSLELARASMPTKEISGSVLIADLVPAKSREQLVGEFLATAKAKPKRFLENAGLCPELSARLLAALARRAGIVPAQRIGEVSRREFNNFAESIKALSMEIKEPFDPAEAIVTLGGVAPRQVNPHTMESLVKPGLFFAGELLAPAGPCGGYNLLMAFATGHAAGSMQPFTIQP